MVVQQPQDGKKRSWLRLLMMFLFLIPICVALFHVAIQVVPLIVFPV